MLGGLDDVPTNNWWTNDMLCCGNSLSSRDFVGGYFLQWAVVWALSCVAKSLGKSKACCGEHPSTVMPQGRTCCRCGEQVLQEFSRDLATEFPQKYWSETFYSVLCIHCEAHLKSLVHQVQGQCAPAVGETLQEGFHYVMEGPNLVFTEAYHMMRGNCCRSGCKHCVYGFKAHHAG